MFGSKGRIAVAALFVIMLFTAAIFAAREVQNDIAIQELVSSFGYFGILLVSFIGGLNIFVPVPATAFIPIFSAAGFSLFSIVVIIVIGTTIADLISYYVGVVLKRHADKYNPKVLELARKHLIGKKYMTATVVFLYAALAPLPNEVLLLPLGALGIKLRILFLPFTIGSVVHVTLVAHGLLALV